MSVVDLFVSGLCKANEKVVSSLGKIWLEGTNNFTWSLRGLAYGNGVVIAVANSTENTALQIGERIE